MSLSLPRLRITMAAGPHLVRHMELFHRHYNDLPLSSPLQWLDRFCGPIRCTGVNSWHSRHYNGLCSPFVLTIDLRYWRIIMPFAPFQPSASLFQPACHPHHYNGRQPLCLLTHYNVLPASRSPFVHAATHFYPPHFNRSLALVCGFFSCAPLWLSTAIVPCFPRHQPRLPGHYNVLYPILMIRFPFPTCALGIITASNPHQYVPFSLFVDTL